MEFPQPAFRAAPGLPGIRGMEGSAYDSVAALRADPSGNDGVNQKHIKDDPLRVYLRHPQGYGAV